MKPLAELSLGYGTDKGTTHSYIPVYEDLFAPYRDRPLSLLEIGVWYGESLKLWRAYFPDASIYGVDNSLERLPKDFPADIVILAGDATRQETFSRFDDGSLDIVIDDASHRIDDQIASLALLWPKLKDGGLYCIEDIQTAGALTSLKAQPHLSFVHEGYKDGQYDDVMVVYRK